MEGQTSVRHLCQPALMLYCDFPGHTKGLLDSPQLLRGTDLAHWGHEAAPVSPTVLPSFLPRVLPSLSANKQNGLFK